MTTPAIVRTAIVDAIRLASLGFLRVEESLDGQLDEEGLRGRSLNRLSAIVAWAGAEAIRPITRSIFEMDATFAIMCVSDGKHRSAEAIDLATKVAALVFNNDWGLAEAQPPEQIRILPFQNDALRTANVSMTIVTFRQALQIEAGPALVKPVTERTGPHFEGVEEIDYGNLGAFEPD